MALKPLFTQVFHVAALLAIGAAAGAAYTQANVGEAVPHGAPSSFNWTPLPEFGGREAIIYRSPDGRRVAAAFEESGNSTFTYSFDEFMVVTSGTLDIRVHGGETIHLKKGDVAYMREGTKVDFSFGANFSDITCLMADHEVKWR
jgi:uncharacterized cupin superfamily protein